MSNFVVPTILTSRDKKLSWPSIGDLNKNKAALRYIWAATTFPSDMNFLPILLARPWGKSSNSGMGCAQSHALTEPECHSVPLTVYAQTGPKIRSVVTVYSAVWSME
jgi:hypothetical protein